MIDHTTRSVPGNSINVQLRPPSVLRQGPN
jgi:hypothetical protein